MCFSTSTSSWYSHRVQIRSCTPDKFEYQRDAENCFITTSQLSHQQRVCSRYMNTIAVYHMCISYIWISEKKDVAIHGIGIAAPNNLVLRFNTDDVFGTPNAPQTNCHTERLPMFILHAYERNGVIIVHIQVTLWCNAPNKYLVSRCSQKM